MPRELPPSPRKRGFFPGISASGKGREGLMFSPRAGGIWIWISAELPESHSPCYYSNRLRNSASIVACLPTENAWVAGATSLSGDSCALSVTFQWSNSWKKPNCWCKSRAKNHGQAEGDLILIGGSFPILCLLKRCEVGEEWRFNLQPADPLLHFQWGISLERHLMATSGTLSFILLAHRCRQAKLLKDCWVWRCQGVPGCGVSLHSYQAFWLVCCLRCLLTRAKWEWETEEFFFSGWGVLWWERWGGKSVISFDFRGFTNKNAQPVTLGCSVGSLLGQGNLRCGNNQSLELIVVPSGIMNEISKA